jgi:hypothetical protein
VGKSWGLASPFVTRSSHGTSGYGTLNRRGTVSILKQGAVPCNAGGTPISIRAYGQKVPNKNVSMSITLELAYGTAILRNEMEITREMSIDFKNVIGLKT